MKFTYLHQQKLNSNGFTLVEMLIYLNLLSFLLLFISRIFLTTLDVQVRSQSASAVQIDDQYLLSRLQYDVYRADAVVSPASVGQITDSLILQIGSETYTYSLVNGELQLTTASGVNAVNSIRTMISNLNFQRQGNLSGVPTILVTYQLQSLFSEDDMPESRSTAVVVGNR